MTQNIFFPTTSCGWFNVNEVARKNTKAIENDFNRDGHTTSEKVSNLMTTFLDYGALVQSASSASMIISTLSLTYSFFFYSPIVNALVMPITVISLVFEAVVGYDIYQERVQIQEFKEWTLQEFPNKEDAFFLNQKFYDRWVEYRKGIDTNTLLIGYLCKNGFDELTKAFEECANQHSFTAEAIISVAKNPSMSTFKRLIGW